MNSENSKISDSRRLLLKLSDTASLEWSDKNVVLSNFSICNRWKNHTKNHMKTINFKYQLRHGMKNLSYLTDTFVSGVQNYFECIIKTT